jgi:hypothetical protein
MSLMRVGESKQLRQMKWARHARINRVVVQRFERAVNSGRRSRCGLRLMLEREKGGLRLDTSLRQTQMGVGDMTIVDAVFGGPDDLCVVLRIL